MILGFPVKVITKTSSITEVSIPDAAFTNLCNELGSNMEAFIRIHTKHGAIIITPENKGNKK